MKHKTSTLLSLLALFANFFFLQVPLAKAQNATKDADNYQKLLFLLESEVRLGHRRALRDLGTLLEKQEMKEPVLRILKNHTFFTVNELDLSKPLGSQTFLDFYYANSRRLKYSPLLQAFYLTPIEQQEPKFEILPLAAKQKEDPSLQMRRLFKEFEDLQASGEMQNLIGLIQKIGALQRKEGYLFLLQALEEDKIGRGFDENPAPIYEEICRELVEYPTAETLKSFLELIDNQKLAPETLAPFLAKLTNVPFEGMKDAQKMEQQYRQLLDTLGSMEAVRDFGYRQQFQIQKSFFQFPVDYYGMILSKTAQFPWVRFNLLKDIVRTHHPRALFYIAAMVFNSKNDPSGQSNPQQYIDLLERLTGLQIKVVGKDGLALRHDWKEDEVARRNFLKYWASHYEDFEWDGVRHSFVNKKEAVALEENYKRLFRRLNSRNDSVAMQAYRLLGEGDPAEVLALAQKYKEMFRRINPILPSFRHPYLEQLVRLTHFCKQNEVAYKPAGWLREKLLLLSETIPERERYALENQIIVRMHPAEVTVLEYWGLLHSGNRAASFSVGRILGRFYSSNWETIVQDDEHLRLFLKKAGLFSNIGVLGICNDYLNKFSALSPSLEKRLHHLLKVEIDEDISSGISELLNLEVGDPALSWSDFLANPTKQTEANLEILPPPDTELYVSIGKAFQSFRSPESNEKLLRFIELHPSVEGVPFLFGLLEKGVFSEDIGQLLERIFQTKLPNGLTEWKEWWEKDSLHYRTWGKRFFEENLKKLQGSEKLKIGDINAVAESPFFRPSHKLICLQALAKVQAVRSIRRLKITPALSIREDLHCFDSLSLGYKELDNIPKLFNLKKDLPILLNWLEDKASGFELEQRSSFYNSLFQLNWFTDQVLDKGLPETMAANMKATLKTYLDESEFISEFEEQVTVRNIALLENIGKTLTERLSASIQLEVEEDSKSKIQEVILARVSYKDLARVVPYFNDLQVLSRYNFLSRDFGLPIFDLQNHSVQQALIKNHRTMTPEALYAHYLRKFGVDFTNEKDELDFKKIYDILRFDIAEPFAATGGSRRDYFVFGLIKLLELHFHTRLGFHEKLNENQTFYTFFSNERAAAWMDFLIEKKLVQKDAKSTPSFKEP